MDTQDDKSKLERVELYTQTVRSGRLDSLNYHTGVPAALLEPLLELMRSLDSWPEAMDATTTMSDAVRAHYLAAQPQLLLRDFVDAARSLEHKDTSASRAIMALARFASRSPDRLIVTCGRSYCQKHVSERCDHVKLASGDNKELLVVDTSSLVELTVASEFHHITGLGSVGRDIVRKVIGRKKRIK